MKGDAHNKRASSLALALVLAAIAGWVDAIGYVHFTRLYVSFMSGNTTTFAIAVGRAEWPQAAEPFLAICAFVLGAFTGALLGATLNRWRIPLTLAAVLLCLSCGYAVWVIGGKQAYAIALLAFAMGVQNAALQREENFALSLTYITGSLIRFSQGLVESLLGRSRERPWKPYALMWLALTTGAVSGTLLYLKIGFNALSAPIAALALLTFVQGISVLLANRAARAGAAATPGTGK